MVLQLDPTIPSVWRTPTSLQFGVAPVRAVLSEVGATTERMIGALELGTTSRALEVLGGVDAAHELLHQLGSMVHETTAVDDRREPPEIRIRSGAITAIRAHLGVLVPDAIAWSTPGSRRPGLLIVDHVVAPAEHLAWVRSDRPHLAVIIGESSITVGPFVRPGVTACLRCRDLHRTDADAAWPAIASQLLSAPAAAGGDPVLLAEALAIGVGAVARGAGPGADTAVSISADGERVFAAVRPHPSCGCFGLVE